MIFFVILFQIRFVRIVKFVYVFVTLFQHSFVSSVKFVCVFVHGVRRTANRCFLILFIHISKSRLFQNHEFFKITAFSKSRLFSKNHAIFKITRFFQNHGFFKITVFSHFVRKSRLFHTFTEFRVFKKFPVQSPFWNSPFDNM